MGLLVDSIYCLILLYIFCDCSHQASLNIASRVQHRLLETALNTVDASTAKEVKNYKKYLCVGYTILCISDWIIFDSNTDESPKSIFKGVHCCQQGTCYIGKNTKINNKEMQKYVEFIFIAERSNYGYLPNNFTSVQD